MNDAARSPRSLSVPLSGALSPQPAPASAPVLLAAAWRSWRQTSPEEACAHAGCDMTLVRFIGEAVYFSVAEAFAASSHPSEATPEQLAAINLYTQEVLCCVTPTPISFVTPSAAPRPLLSS